MSNMGLRTDDRTMFDIDNIHIEADAARDTDLSFNTDQSQPAWACPDHGSEPHPPGSVFTDRPQKGGVSVGYTGSSNALEDLHGNPPPSPLPSLESTPSVPPPLIAGRTRFTYLRTR
jgi:hypothetical protein